MERRRRQVPGKPQEPELETSASPQLRDEPRHHVELPEDPVHEAKQWTPVQTHRLGAVSPQQLAATPVRLTAKAKMGHRNDASRKTEGTPTRSQSLFVM